MTFVPKAYVVIVNEKKVFYAWEYVITVFVESMKNKHCGELCISNVHEEIEYSKQQRQFLISKEIMDFCAFSSLEKVYNAG